jgi:protein SYS1
MARRRRPPRPGALTELPPLKILTQIFILQTIYYVCGTAMILFATLVAGKDFSADLVLHWKSLRGDTTVGWMLGLCWMGNSFVGCGLRFLYSLAVLFFLSGRDHMLPVKLRGLSGN